MSQTIFKQKIRQVRSALPPTQNREAVVELHLDLPNLCLIALGGTQPCTACLGVALNYLS